MTGAVDLSPASDALVLFGASGDLARRKLFGALYRLEEAGRLDMPVVGVASSKWSDDDLRERARTALDDAAVDVDEKVFNALAARLAYESGDYRDPDLYRRLEARLSGARLPTCYLAIPPALFVETVERLSSVGLNRGRVVVEKPFGRDLVSAVALNDALMAHYDEASVFRIDHFLGKEALQNLLVARFANGIWEPLWNRHHVTCVQVTMAEDFGVEGRGRFYDSVGALRDVVQNHLLQLVCMLAMEPPVSVGAADLHDEVVKVLKAVRPLDPASVVRGQYVGYRDEPGVDPYSDVDTFVALCLEIDSWRWAGVPFFVRAGKCMEHTVTEAVVEFRAPPRLLFTDADVQPEPNQWRYGIKPQEITKLVVQAKVPGDRLQTQPVALEVNRASALGEGPEAYERLLGDALQGDSRLFARDDALVQSWRIVDPVVARPPAVELYEPGTWGPPSAAKVAAQYGGWRVC